MFWQPKAELIEQHALLDLRLGVTRQHEFAAIAGGNADIHHLHHLELGQRFTRRQAGGRVWLTLGQADADQARGPTRLLPGGAELHQHLIPCQLLALQGA